MSDYFKRLAQRSNLTLPVNQPGRQLPGATGAQPGAQSSQPKPHIDTDIEVHEQREAAPLRTTMQAPASQPMPATPHSDTYSGINGDAVPMSQQAQPDPENLSQNSYEPTGAPGSSITNSRQDPAIFNDHTAPLDVAVSTVSEPKSIMENPQPGSSENSSATAPMIASALSAEAKPEQNVVVATTEADQLQSSTSTLELTQDGKALTPQDDPPKWGNSIETATPEVSSGDASADNSVLELSDFASQQPNGSSFARVSAARPSVPKTSTPANNRVEIRIGKIDLEIHRPSAVQKPAPPKPRSRPATSSTNIGNNLSRYYLRGGIG